MGELGYPYEKFYNAVSVLARSPRRIQDRILSAYMSFHPIKSSDFKDPEMATSYQEIMDRLTTVKDSEKGHVPATLDQMSDSEASVVADKIVDLFVAIARAHR